MFCKIYSYVFQILKQTNTAFVRSTSFVIVLLLLIFDSQALGIVSFCFLLCGIFITKLPSCICLNFRTYRFKSTKWLQQLILSVFHTFWNTILSEIEFVFQSLLVIKYLVTAKLKLYIGCSKKLNTSLKNCWAMILTYLMAQKLQLLKAVTL